MKFKIRYFLCALLLFCVCVPYRPSPAPKATGRIEIPKAELTEPNAVEVPKAEPVEVTIEVPEAELAEPNIVEIACELIYQGKFDAAGELIKSSSTYRDASCKKNAQYATRNTQCEELAKIVQEYQTISQRRRKAREAAYAERLAELEKFRVAADTNDVNDVNDTSAILSVIAKACEFANEAQRSELLCEPFVERTIQKVKTRASEFEAEGKWLDAYITCYSWLQAIEPNNEAYSAYAEQLIERANIASSFQDSPCETSEERYESVVKQMFVRAINALNSNYVSIIDYRQMATKAIRRCELLAEVMRDSYLERDTECESDPERSEERLGAQIQDTQYTAWSAALAVISDEVKQSPMGVSRDKFIDVFEKVLALNEATAGLPEGILIAQFAEAALGVLDAHTVMIWPRQVEDFEKAMTNEFTGIGIEISKPKGLLTVISLLPDTPAYYSGLDAEDVIEAVDGVETKDMTLICAVRNITGPEGTKVTLTVRSPGQRQSRDITITRAKITVPTIRGWQRTEAGKWLYMIDEANKIGYVRITNFSEKTASDFEKILVQLEAEGLKGLILDLRFNSGGLLDSAIQITDKFIKEGPIVITRSRSWVSSTYAAAHKAKTHPGYPLVVVANQYSASASEIVAGALADELHNRAILVGERTHGKGSVQGITHYPKGGAHLKYTMAYYHLPSGQRVESREAMEKRDRKDWGVGPNIEVKLRSDEFRKMVNVQKDNDVLVKADHDNGSVPLRKHTAEETLAADPQLAVGVLVIKSKLIEGSG